LAAPFLDSDAARSLERACSAAADGRRAARALGQWCDRFALGEPEFQVLWTLRDLAGGGFDQTMLARRLAYSPAQVSATVERLRARGWIAQQAIEGDRRRNLWCLSAAGNSAVIEMLQAAQELRWEVAAYPREAAA
jgi:DNA-binding MarR family transcriptional regulator